MATPLTESEITRIAGPLLVGYLLNWGLFGVLSMQVYIYYLAFPRDPKGQKALIYGVFALESAQTFLFTNSAFRSFATGFGNPQMLDEVDILWFTVPIMSGIVACIVQIFYAHRISVLAKNKYVPSAIILLSFLQLGGAIAIGVQTKQALSFSSFLRTNSFVAAGIWEGASTACDVIIAVCMTFYLWRRDAGIKQTSVLFTRIIRLTVETGTLTAVIAILTLILTFLPGRPSFYQASVSVLGKVYANSMMVVFNSRMKIGVTGSTSVSTHEVEIPTIANARSQRETDTLHALPGVLITREEVVFPSDSGLGMSDKKGPRDDDRASRHSSL